MVDLCTLNRLLLVETKQVDLLGGGGIKKKISRITI